MRRARSMKRILFDVVCMLLISVVVWGRGLLGGVAIPITLGLMFWAQTAARRGGPDHPLAELGWIDIVAVIIGGPVLGFVLGAAVLLFAPAR